MNKKTTREAIVLGMHRSGTSMVSGVLERLGVHMGEDQPGRQVSNPMGHFEDGDFLSLNETILAEAGGSWDRPPALDQIQNQAETFKGDLQQIIEFKEMASQNQFWGWKDPRTSLTIQLFLPYLKNPHVIWCHRDPADIAKSLWKRNKISQKESDRITVHYQGQIRDFLNDHPDIPVLNVQYKDILDDPERYIQKIVDFLGLDPNKGQLNEAREFILPRKKIEREKKILWWKYLLSLPIRYLRKLGIIADQ